MLNHSEILFYCGSGIAAFTVVSAIICVLIEKKRASSLSDKLDAEYGKKTFQKKK